MLASSGLCASRAISAAMTSSSAREGSATGQVAAPDAIPVDRCPSNEQRRLARALGSTDWHARDSGIKQVLAQLAQLGDLPDAAARQLWKGLFYAFWHSDKAKVQVGRHAVGSISCTGF